MNTILEFIYFVKSFCSIYWQVMKQMWQRPFYYKLLIKNMYDFGYRSLFIIIVLGICLGFILTLHIGVSLEKYGAKMYVPKIIALALLGEFATVLAPLILAARIGAGITSEIGTMKVTEQIDAFRALGISHIKRVIIPKVLACMVIIPILSLFVSIIGLLTGAYIGYTHLNLDPIYFIAKALYTPKLIFFLFSVFKTFIFSIFIAITSCHYGLSISKGSYEIGRATMTSVVVSSLLIIFGDVLLTNFYYSFLHY